MLWPGVDNARLIRVPKGGESVAARLSHALTNPAWRADAITLKPGEDGAVFDALLAGTPVVIKTKRLLTMRDRLSSALGTSRLMRQWNGAVTLDRAGVRSAMPLALVRGLDTRGEIVETLIMERIEGRSLLEHLRDDDLHEDEMRALTESMARDLEAMWLRAFNRDHKPSNLIVTHENEGLRAAVVDTVGVRRLRGLGGGSNARLARMLASLMIEPIGTGCAPDVRRSYRLVCRVCDAPSPKGAKKPGWNPRKAFGYARTMWEMTSELVRDHPDPTPKDSPFPERTGA